MVQTNAFKYMRRENHKSRVQLNEKSRMSVTIARLQILNVDKVNDGCKPMAKGVVPLELRASLREKIIENLLNKQQTQSKTLQKPEQGYRHSSSFYVTEVAGDKRKKQIEAFSKLIFKKDQMQKAFEVRAKLETKVDSTLDLGTSGVHIEPFGFMHSRINLKAPVSRINLDSIKLSNHLKGLEADYSNFTIKLNNDMLTYRTTEEVVPDPTQFNEFYKVEKRNRMNLAPFKELDKMYRPPLEPIDKLFLGGTSHRDRENTKGLLKATIPNENNKTIAEASKMATEETIDIPVHEIKKQVVPPWAPRHPRFSIKAEHPYSTSLNQGLKFSAKRSMIEEDESPTHEEVSANELKEASQNSKDIDIEEIPLEVELQDVSNLAADNTERNGSPFVSKTRSNKNKRLGSMKSPNGSEGKLGSKKNKLSVASVTKISMVFPAKDKSKRTKFTMVPKMLTINSFRPMSKLT